ncbi:S1C family serine protease [Kitasatospora sp. NPDC002227]|uniref:S1C family serine protease n=1 Tax=Kitasatospora sp. NPDC002227 TaxID=3154773 RepID=UPI00332DC793
MGLAVVRVCDPEGRTRGLGFVADLSGAVVTAHEAVAGLSRVVLHLPGGQTRVLGESAVEAWPEYGLAVLRMAGVGGLPVPPLPVATGAPGQLVAVPYLRPGSVEPALSQGGVLAAGPAVYPWRESFHLVEAALLLDLPQLAAAPTPGAPVLDAETGAVLAVVTPGLRSGHEQGVPAVPLHGEGLAELLARNAATVPAYGRALNLGGVLQLASVQLGSVSAGPGRITDLAADRVDRPDGLTGEEPQCAVTALVGAAGSGRTTELAALTVRRAGGPQPLPTLWLRGAELAATDGSPAPAVARELARAAALLEVAVPEPEEVALLCAAAGRPLLVVLDAPEEAQAALSDRWLAACRDWLARTGARLLLACRPEEWERLAPALPQARPHGLGPLPAEAADRAARRYGLPGGWLGPAEAAHPLALRIAGELHGDGVRGPAPGLGELFAAYFDLGCLRVARRLAAGAQVRPPGAHRRGAARPAGERPGRVRRLAAVVAGRLHEAARVMLAVGHGGLSRAAFEALFPEAGGWARAVLAEGVFVPAGDGYRLAHEEFAEWLQGLHLDLEGALRLLLAEPVAEDRAGEDRAQAPDRTAEGARRGASGAGADPGHGVPRHRVGPVVAGLRRAGRDTPALDLWLRRVWRGLAAAAPGSEEEWWAGRVLATVLAQLPEPGEHRELLELLAGRGERAGEFGPAFWAALPLGLELRLDLLRRLVRTDGPAQSFRTATAELLVADPQAVLPLLCAWFEDDSRPAALPGATVADLAHDLLYAHRSLALDNLTECLVAAAHPRADALLSLLAVEEPSALCRAVDRWSHDPRPERHVAAAVHALRAAPYATGPGPGLLRFAAASLLAREGEPALHGAALALLVRYPQTRAQHLERALAAYRADDPFVTAEVLAPALAAQPQPVLAALRARLAEPGAAVAEALRLLAETADPATARQGQVLAAELLREHPEWAGQLADYLDRLLARGQRGTALLAELRRRPPAVRRLFAVRLALPGGAGRAAALDALLIGEREESVLLAVLERTAETCAEHEPRRVRELVRKAAAAGRSPEPELVRCAGRSAAFARLLAEWPETEPPPADGPLLARMRALVAEGRDPQYAAAEAERAAGALPVPRPPRAASLPVPKPGRAHGTL